MIVKAFYTSLEKIKERIVKYKNVKSKDELSFEEKKELECIEQNVNLKCSSALEAFNISIFKDDNGDYYHYTDLNGVLGIFKSYINSSVKDNVQNCVMWASNIRFLNDAQEYVGGHKRYEGLKNENLKIEYKHNIPHTETGVEKHLRAMLSAEEEDLLKSQFEVNENELSEKYMDFYSISFCGKGDLLSQWKYYGKNSGIAIEFNFEGATCRIGDSEQKIAVCPLKVAYTDEEKIILYIMSALTYIDDSYIVQTPQADVFIPFCKDKLFEEEVESRLVFARQGEKCEYMVSNGIIKPYIPVEFTAAPGKNIIKSITVGPGQNQNLVYNALIHIFNTDKFAFKEDGIDPEIDISDNAGNLIKIKKSLIPFRG